MSWSDPEAIRARLKTLAPARIEAAGAAEASVALVLAPDEKGELGILFIKRSEHPGDPWSGQMAFPGGRREVSDRDPCATAVRETFEETGITLSKGLLLGELDDLHLQNRALPSIIVRPFVFTLPGRPQVTPSGEVAGHLWASISELRAGACRARVQIRREGVQVRAYRVGPAVIWGMTHRILSQFLGLL